jgi:hypothetical protein
MAVSQSGRGTDAREERSPRTWRIASSHKVTLARRVSGEIGQRTSRSGSTVKASRAEKTQLF